jgi:hypothetical protein
VSSLLLLSILLVAAAAADATATDANAAATSAAADASMHVFTRVAAVTSALVERITFTATAVSNDSSTPGRGIVVASPRVLECLILLVE